MKTNKELQKNSLIHKNDDLEKIYSNLKILKKQSVISLISILGIINSIIFLVSLFWVQHWSIITICGISLMIFIVLAIYHYKNINKTKTEMPYKIKLNKVMSYNDILNILNTLALKDNRLKIDEDQSAYKINKRYFYRILVTNVDCFNKKDYDLMKKRANKKYNVKFKPEKWGGSELYKMMRINIIYTTKLTNELDNYLSNNSLLMLTRVEGIINFVICNDTLLVPPLYGDTSIKEVERYEKCLKFILEVLN